MPDSSWDQESQSVCYDSNPDNAAFPHFASTHIQSALLDGPHSEVLLEAPTSATSKNKKPAYPNGYPKEVFDLFRNFPEYPTSGSNEDQLNFVAAKLNEVRPFPKEVHDLWREHFNEYPVFEKDQKVLDLLIVKTMRKWSEDSTCEKDSTSKKQRRMKKVCEIDVLKRRVEDGAEAVQLIRPDFERIPDFEQKLASLIDSCVEHEQVSSLELQVCCCANLKILTRQLTLFVTGNPSWRFGG